MNKMKIKQVPNSSDKPYELQKSGRRRKPIRPINITSQIVMGLKLIFLLLLLITAVTVTYFALGTDEIGNFFGRLASKHGYNRSQFVVIIDAGYSYSRLTAYRFEWGFIDNRLLIFEELYYEQTPGLPAYMNYPPECVEPTQALLKKAKAFIPENKWSSTPLILKANAELRQLPKDKLDDLLNAVRDIFANVKFIVDVNAVEIMEDSDKAIFSWLSINLIFKRFAVDKQIAALDLSENGMQVTFTPIRGYEESIYASYMRKMHTLKHQFNVFTNSYPGLGVQAVRHAVFTEGFDKNVLNIESICVNSIIKNRTWTYGNLVYNVSGKPINRLEWNLMLDFNACYNLVKSKVKPIPKPNIFSDQPVLAFGYYFEAVVESGMIDPLEEGTTVTVAGHHKNAREICNTPNNGQPFLCFDLVYISVLLREVFELSDKKKIWLYQRYNGHQISWALGYVYNMLLHDERWKSLSTIKNI